MVVVARLGCMKAGLAGKGGAQHFLGRSLADRAGDRHDARPGPGAGGGAELFECRLDIGHQQQGSVSGDALGDTADKGGGGAFFQCEGHEIMPVTDVFQCHEKIALRQGAGVDGDPGRLPVGRELATCGGGGGGGCPERGHFGLSL